MRRLPASEIFGIAQQLGEFQTTVSHTIGTPEASSPVPDKKRQEWGPSFKTLEAFQDFAAWMPASHNAVVNINTALADPTTTLWQASELLRDFGRRMQFEMGQHLYLQVDPSLTVFFVRPLEGWEAVLKSYPQNADLEREIIEASRTVVVRAVHSDRISFDASVRNRA